jgi:hypothetical protein
MLAEGGERAVAVAAAASLAVEQSYAALKRIDDEIGVAVWRWRPSHEDMKRIEAALAAPPGDAQWAVAACFIDEWAIYPGAPDDERVGIDELARALCEALAWAALRRAAKPE